MDVKCLLVFLALDHFVGEKFLPSLLILVILICLIKYLFVVLNHKDMLSRFDKVYVEVHLMTWVDSG